MPKRKLNDKENTSDDFEELESSSTTATPIIDIQASEASDDEIEEDVFNDDEIHSDNDIIDYEYADEDDDIHLTSEQPMDVESTEDMVPTSDISKEFFSNTVFRTKIWSQVVAFLNTFGDRKYVKKIRSMCSNNQESVYVSYADLSAYSEDLVKLLDVYPDEMLAVMDDGLDHVVKMYFPNYGFIRSKVHCRIVDLPVLEGIRSLRNHHINRLVRVKGVVTRRTGIFPLYSIIKYTCLKCNATFGPFVGTETKPSHCFECQCKGPFNVNLNETVYKDFQKLTIQEIPGTVPPGTLPRSREVLLYYDLIDCAKPGEEVEITGIYKNNYNVSLNIKNGFPVFFTVIEANSISRSNTEVELTDEDIKDIKRMSKNPNIKDIIIDSISPSIYGHRNIKRAIALAMFGGVSKERNNHRTRGDINVLLLGDPGTAKSQFLRYVEKAARKAVLATGQGASAVGLTATVRKDPIIKEWTLEGGALVLADNGICLIDEFDKMNEHDRTSIHEAMEQQSISISKAGIVASLHARCSVIAAANPVRGKYNPALTFAQNVNLSDPIISRFDILCVVKDVIDVKEDEIMANFIVSTHKGDTHMNDSVLSQDFLKKYVMFAKSTAKPVLSNLDIDKITHLYADLRKESMASGLPITVRHIESIIRISESFARMELRPFVTSKDIDDAISTVLESFMSAQKYSLSKNLKKKFLKYFNANSSDALMYVLNEMFNERMKAFSSNYVLYLEFEKRAKDLGFSVDMSFMKSDAFTGGFVYDESSMHISRSGG